MSTPSDWVMQAMGEGLRKRFRGANLKAVRIGSEQKREPVEQGNIVVFCDRSYPQARTEAFEGDHGKTSFRKAGAGDGKGSVLLIIRDV